MKRDETRQGLRADEGFEAKTCGTWRRFLTGVLKFLDADEKEVQEVMNRHYINSSAACTAERGAYA